MEFETAKDIFLALAEALQEGIAQRVVEQMQADEPPRARLLALDEIVGANDRWLEVAGNDLLFPVAYAGSDENEHELGFWNMSPYYALNDDYGATWRVWKGEPDAERRASVPWKRLKMRGDQCRACRVDRLRKLMDDMQAISTEALGIMREAAEILAEIDEGEDE